MKQVLHFSIVLFLILSTTFSARSQPNNKVKRMEIFMKVAPSDTTNLYGDTLFQSNTKLQATMFIVVKDTIHISTLHVKFGSASGSGNLLQKSFQFDVSGVFSDGTSYNRKRNIIQLGLGEFMGLNNYSAELQIEDDATLLYPVSVYSK